LRDVFCSALTLLLFYAFHIVVVIVVAIIVLHKFSVQLISVGRQVGLYFCNSVGHGKFRQSNSCVCAACPL